MKTEDIEQFVRFFETEQQSFGERKEFSSELKALKTFRRLDALAMIFECVTNCVAVSIINDHFVIAINKIMSKTAVNDSATLHKIVGSVFNYLQDIANNQRINEDLRRQTFKQICLPSRFISQVKGAKINVIEGNVDDVVNSVLSGEEFKEILEQYGRDLGIPVIAADSQNLLRNIRKLETSVLKASKSDFSEIDEEYLTAIKEGRFRLLEQPNEPNFHAEMQLVFEILGNNVPGTHYIGISRLCCMQCHAMFLAVNNGSDATTFLTRGWHDRSDPSTRVPERIMNNFSDINLRFGEICSSQAQSAQTQVSIKHDYSSSEGSEPDSQASNFEELTRKRELLTGLAAETKLLDDLVRSGQTTLTQHQKIIDFGLTLHENMYFRNLFNISHKSEDNEIHKLVRPFVEHCGEQNFYMQQVLEFFKSSYFAIPQKELVVQIVEEEASRLLAQPHEKDAEQGTPLLHHATAQQQAGGSTSLAQQPEQPGSHSHGEPSQGPEKSKPE